MSIQRKKTPRHEVISLRMTDERVALLERARRALADQLGRTVSLAETVFLVIEDRAVGMDRAATRHELLRTPTTSLDRIRRRWGSAHTLAAAEWDVLAEYVQIGADEARQAPPQRRPAIPSRASYLVLLDAFEVLYRNRKEPAAPQAWHDVANLDGDDTEVTRSGTDADQRDQAVLQQIAHRRALLASTDQWQPPGNIGWCVWAAIRDGEIESTRLDQILAPHWPTLWGLAARGHWIRHDGQPVRTRAAHEDDDGRRPVMLPNPLTSGDLTLSWVPVGDAELGVQVDFGARGVRCRIHHYPELMEWRAMLDAPDDQPWRGRYVAAGMAGDTAEGGPRSVWLTPEACIDVSAREWIAFRDLVQRVSQCPDGQRWLHERWIEYGEHG